MARSRQQTSETVATMRRAVRELDPDLPTYGPSSLSDTIAENVAPWRFVNFLFGACGLLALTLASVGLYGVLSHSVIRRTREIAVRLAMGARRGHTAWLILKRAMVLVVIGLSIGVGAAIGLSRLIGHFVSDLDALDPVTYLVASLVVVAASLLASWVPAYGIIRLEPMEALRHE
jgi:ABC-type antimicrobial peptide transport system permease subunit